ncbi:MAG TPA: phage tail sheath C-terminal domain-containing protein [Chitinophagaceae bacterium]|nr:phage tail sheath C-terminal domain-containing protein [Chitinophagaceae bacterium]
MSKEYKTPGVYVEEISKFPPSIAAVETAIPAFIGYTQKAQKHQVGDLAFTPTRISSLVEYEYYFGSLVNESLTITIDDEITKNGIALNLDSRKLTVRADFLKNCMHYHLQLYFANGGGPCYIVSTGRPKASLNKKELKKGLDEIYNCDEPTLILFPDGVNLLKAIDLYSVYNDALTHACELKDRFVIMDISNNDLGGLSAIELFRSSITGGEHAGGLKYGAAYYPMLVTTIPYRYTDNTVKIIHNTIIKEPGKAGIKGKGEFDKYKLNNVQLNGTAIYSLIKNEIAEQTIILSPSAAVAGVYASTDQNRGVWKAPANASLSLVKAPSVSLTNNEQATLNIDAQSGKSINAIRYFAEKGTLVWGGRTLAGNDNEWRYISVRRFFNMVEESVKKGTVSFVFEPNDANTWTKVRAMIENFLILLWRQGALQGAKPDDAFYVKAGLGQTMTAQDILEGRMIIEIGMAAVRPAEFIIIRISHQMQQS